MTQPGRTTIDLGPDFDRHKESLRALAAALGLSGISELNRRIADTYSAAPAETVALLEAAIDRANGGDEWSAFEILHDLLPPFSLSVQQDARVSESALNWLGGLAIQKAAGRPLDIEELVAADPAGYAALLDVVQQENDSE